MSDIIQSVFVSFGGAKSGTESNQYTATMRGFCLPFSFFFLFFFYQNTANWIFPVVLLTVSI